MKLPIFFWNRERVVEMINATSYEKKSRAGFHKAIVRSIIRHILVMSKVLTSDYGRSSTSVSKTVLNNKKSEDNSYVPLYNAYVHISALLI